MKSLSLPSSIEPVTRAEPTTVTAADEDRPALVTDPSEVTEPAVSVLETEIVAA